MLTSPWDLALVRGGFVLNAVLPYATYLYARQSTPAAATGAATADGDAGASDDGVVECRHCGAGNEPGYRFCRACVSELPARRGTVVQKTAGPVDIRREFATRAPLGSPSGFVASIRECTTSRSAIPRRPCTGGENGCTT